MEEWEVKHITRFRGELSVRMLDELGMAQVRPFEPHLIIDVLLISLHPLRLKTFTHEHYSHAIHWTHLTSILCKGGLTSLSARLFTAY